MNNNNGGIIIQIFPGHFSVSYIVYNILLLLLGNYLQPDMIVVFLAIIVGLLPDLIDIIYSLISGIGFRSKDHEMRHHSWPTHFPIFYIPFIIICIIFPCILTFSMAINIYLHFLGDSFFTDDGIRWLWPFSKRYFKLLSKSMEGKHDKKWVVFYRKTPLWKIEWILFGISASIIIFNSYILYGMILFIITLIFLIFFIILLLYIENKVIVKFTKECINEKNNKK